MKSPFRFPLMIVAALVAVCAYAAPDLSPAPLLLGLAPGAADDSSMPYRRLRADLDQFEGVAATSLATSQITRKPLTLLGVTLYLSGTTFNETHITELRVKLGTKPIWGGTLTGPEIKKLNAYKGYYNGNRQFVYIDFTQLRAKQWGGWGVGGIDFSKLPEGIVTLEVRVVGATAPAIVAKGHWGPPQANGIMQRLLQFTSAISSSGRKKLALTFDGGRLRRLFVMYTGTDWVATGVATAFTANTGNGVMGAITVAAGAQAGVHKFYCVQANANAGTFLHQTPDGIIQSLRMIVAAAYSNAGLAFTLADGAADYIPGDGFEIAVSENSDGNVQRVEVIKDDVTVWDFYCHEARSLQKQNGFVPQSLMYVVDFEADNFSDGALVTTGTDGTIKTTKLEFAITLGASDNLTMYAEVLNVPPAV